MYESDSSDQPHRPPKYVAEIATASLARSDITSSRGSQEFRDISALIILRAGLFDLSTTKNENHPLARSKACAMMCERGGVIYVRSAKRLLFALL